MLVVNPQATATTPAGRDILAYALSSELKLEVVETDYRGHAMDAAARAALENVDLVVAHGGDGTVNEVVNGLRSAPHGARAPMLGVVPGGSANVFARAIGIPRDPVEATHQLLGALAEGRARDVALGRAADRWFTFNAGLGWDADVVAGVERKRSKQASPGLYARKAVAAYLRPPHGRAELTLTMPGQEPIDGIRTVFLSNTDPWSYLGSRPLHLNPGCSLNGGLGVFALRSLSLPTVVKHLVQALRKNGKQRGRRLIREDNLEKLSITATQPVNLQVDGDLLGQRTAVEFSCTPRALRVVA